MKHTTLVGALSSVALAVGLAAGGYGIASAASSSPAHATSGGTVPGPVYGGPGGHSGFGGRGGFGGPGGPGRGPGFGGGVITASAPARSPSNAPTGRAKR